MHVNDHPVNHRIIIFKKEMQSKLDFHAIPFLDKSPRENPHESSQTHQLHPKFFQHTINGAIKLHSAPVQFVVHHLVGIGHANNCINRI